MTAVRPVGEAGGDDRPPVSIDATDSVNRAWKKTERGSQITVARREIIGPDTKVFAMGSCFAVEIRRKLRDRGISVYPAYRDIEFDEARVKIGLLPGRDNINHYDSFNIRQEFQRVFEPEGVAFPLLPVREGGWPDALGGRARFQDPYRRDTVGVDAGSLQAASDAISAAIREAVLTADVYVITLGLVEAWRDRVTGNHVWGARVRRLVPDPERIEFHLSTYQENYESIRWVCDSLAAGFPNRQVVLTVSPVPLNRTFADNDVVVANSYSKAVLRAVAGQIANELDNVSYWPSYEIAMSGDSFADDGRHVTDEAVEAIVDGFLDAHAAR